MAGVSLATDEVLTAGVPYPGTDSVDEMTGTEVTGELGVSAGTDSLGAGTLEVATDVKTD